MPETLEVKNIPGNSFNSSNIYPELRGYIKWLQVIL